MEISGERECLNCGNTWSYFETRSIECSECGSIKSRSTSSPELDTDSSQQRILDVNDIYPLLQSDIEEGVKEAGDRSREYITSRGFIRGGEIIPPDPTYVMAREVMEIHDYLDTTSDFELSKQEKSYIIDLIQGIEKGNPPRDRPDSMDPHHYMAVARTAEEYSTEMFRYLNENNEEIPNELERARTLAKRTKSTNGETNDAKKALRILRDLQNSLQS